MLSYLLLFLSGCIVAIIIGIFLIHLDNKRPFSGEAPVFLGIGLIIIGIICTIISIAHGVTLNNERIHEKGCYDQYIIMGKTLEDAITTSNEKDIATSEIYVKAVEFNKDLAKKKYFYERGGYIPISGKYDWSAIPYVNISK